MNAFIGANPKVLWREVDGEIVILDPKSGRYYGIEGVGVRIWRLLQTQTTFQRILRALAEEYDADEKRLRSDVSKFLERLERSQLLEPN